MTLLRRALCIAGISSTTLSAQARVTITDVGPGASGRILQLALAQPHRLIEPDTSWFILGRNREERATLVILGRNAGIAGRVDGDVIVVDGDLFVRPGAHITGRAIAIGGGVYPSALGFIGQGTQSFRDNTFAITGTSDGYRLAYVSMREHATPPLQFPGVYGLRFPTYDRVNGVSLSFGPTLTVAGGNAELDAQVSYRSDLGKFDPALSANLQLGRRLRVRVNARRGTLSNDAWIWPDLVNSMSVLGYGIDTRNYYRADRAEVTLYRVWEWASTEIEPFLGVLSERAWSVGPALNERRGPWSIFRRTDSLAMWRPNPSIDDGSITSVLAGSGLQWDSQDLKVRARTRAELSAITPADERFVQLTSDIEVSFPTFAEQEYTLDIHWVTTPGEVTPRQRFVFLGGSGTLPFLQTLELGGDELLLIDQRYSIPLLKIELGTLGNPTLILRHRMGSAGIGDLPSLEQMIGLGVMLAIIRGELLVDPVRRKVRFGIGFAFAR